MVTKRFRLTAHISSETPDAVRPVLERWFAKDRSIRPVLGGYEVSAELEGENARDINRDLLSELRRAERRTRLRSEWTSGGVIERFFDYVPKGTRKALENAPVR
jgi:hypothetical protein